MFLILVIVIIMAFVAYGLISKTPGTLEKITWRLILILVALVPLWLITYRSLVRACQIQAGNACMWKCWIGFC